MFVCVMEVHNNEGFVNTRFVEGAVPPISLIKGGRVWVIVVNLLAKDVAVDPGTAICPSVCVYRVTAAS